MVWVPNYFADILHLLKYLKQNIGVAHDDVVRSQNVV